MIESAGSLLAQSVQSSSWFADWLKNVSAAFLVNALGILFYLALALLVTVFSQRIAWWIERITRRFTARERPSEQRVQTVHQLYASLISMLGVLLALIGILRIFVDSTQLVWMVGLFSAAFGWGARGMVSDMIAGTNYIFQNTFAIGEKLEFWLTANRVEGIVERVNLRNTLLRAPTGELLAVPNGDIGVIRNYTRAAWSGAQLRVCVPTAKLALALATLEQAGREQAGRESNARLTTLLEPWQVLVLDEKVGAETEVTVIARFAFGTAGDSRPIMVQVVHDALQNAGALSDESAGLPVA